MKGGVRASTLGRQWLGPVYGRAPGPALYTAHARTTLLALSANLVSPVLPAVVVVTTPYGLAVISCTCCTMRALGKTSAVSPCHCQRTMPWISMRISVRRAAMRFGLLGCGWRPV